MIQLIEARNLLFYLFFKYLVVVSALLAIVLSPQTTNMIKSCPSCPQKVWRLQEKTLR